VFAHSQQSRKTPQQTLPPLPPLYLALATPTNLRNADVTCARRLISRQIELLITPARSSAAYPCSVAPWTARSHAVGQPRIPGGRPTVRGQTSLAHWPAPKIPAIWPVCPQTRSARYRLSINGIRRYRRGVPGAHREARCNGSGTAISVVTDWECKSASNTNYPQQHSSALHKVPRLVLDRRQGWAGNWTAA
jgi:hypothetical protein